MTTIKDFEDLNAWRKARELAGYVYALTRKQTFARDFGLCHQIQEAAGSAMHNIAEGFERGSTAELLAFLYYARGSAGEVRSMLCLSEGLARFEHLKSQISDLN